MDVTDATAAQRELLSERIRITHATRAARVGTSEYDVATHRLHWDEQMHRLYDTEPARFRGMYDDWREALHEEDRPRATREIEWAIEGEKDFDTEFRVLWRDGSVHTLRAVAQVLRDEAGRPLRMVGTNWEISAQKRLEEQLRWNATFLGLMTSSSPFGFYVVDNRTDQILYANHRFCEIWGLTSLSTAIFRGELTNSEIIPYCVPILLDSCGFC
ncbi:MAG: PAS domain-containing protein [Polyangiaceae bacterium]